MFSLLTALSLFISTSSQTFSQAPTTGCDVITYDGHCFSYFTSGGINWFSARSECANWGGDLATIHTGGEEDLLATIRNVNLRECWIGLNDLEEYNVWRWADGSNSSFRNWEDGEPTSNNKIVEGENCVTKDYKSPKWDDTNCYKTHRCYYCGAEVIPFQIQTNTSVITTDQTTLYENITIQCITENKDTQHVVWSYVDLDGSRSVLSSPTSLITGVSTLSVSTDNPGYYSCQITQQAGVSRTYGVRIRDPAMMIVPTTGCDVITYDGHCFSYFTSGGINWFSARSECAIWGGDLATIHTGGEEDLIATIRNVNLRECWIGLNDLEEYNVWRWADGSNSSFRNWEDGQPSSNNEIQENQNCVTKYWRSLKWDDSDCSSNQHCYYCSAEVIPLKLMSIPTLNSNKNTTLRENITIQCITENKDTQHVVWSYVALDGSRSVLSSPTSLITGVSTLSVSTDNPGYYSCQVTQQAGVSRTYGVRIRDFTSLEGTYGTQIANFQTETSSPTSILVSWNLLHNRAANQYESFSVYYGIGEVEVLATITRFQSYNITGLVSCVNYAVRVEMNSVQSNLSFDVRTFHSLKQETTTSPITQSTQTIQPPDSSSALTSTGYAIIGLIVTAVVLFTIISFGNVLFCQWMAKKTNSQLSQSAIEQENLLDTSIGNRNVGGRSNLNNNAESVELVAVTNPIREDLV